MKQLLTLLILCMACTAKAQSTDTLITYYDKKGEPCAKDTAVSWERIFPFNGKYKWQSFAVAGLMLDGIYADFKTEIPAGDFNRYDGKGTLIETTKYDERGHETGMIFWYASGKKRSEMIIRGKQILSEKGWDENGNEIPDFIVQREATFPGGSQGWKEYLENNLRTDVPVRANMPKGLYEVVVSFLVDKEGKITEVQGSTTSACKPCVDEAIRVIKRGPKWIPAIQNNRQVIYRQKQSISFLVQ